VTCCVDMSSSTKVKHTRVERCFVSEVCLVCEVCFVCEVCLVCEGLSSKIVVETLRCLHFEMLSWRCCAFFGLACCIHWFTSSDPCSLLHSLVYCTLLHSSRGIGLHVACCMPLEAHQCNTHQCSTHQCSKLRHTHQSLKGGRACVSSYVRASSWERERG